MCKTSQHTFKESTKETFMKLWKTMAVPNFIHRCKNLNLTQHERRAGIVKLKFLG